MNNTDKLLRAFIEASGFDIETIQPVPVSEWSPGVVYDMNVTYKVTKKSEPFLFGSWMGVDIIIQTEQRKELDELIAHLGAKPDANI